MTASTKLARAIRVAIKQGDRGVFVATSPNLKGLLAVSKDVDHLVSHVIPKAIADLYMASGQPVIVTRLDQVNDTDSVLPWVVVPITPDVAKQAMELECQTA